MVVSTMDLKPHTRLKDSQSGAGFAQPSFRVSNHGISEIDAALKVLCEGQPASGSLCPGCYLTRGKCNVTKVENQAQLSKQAGV